MAAIKEARENMGDYKLKTAKDYVVPESLRVNAEKKRIQLLNLLDQVNCASYLFIHALATSCMPLKKKKIVGEILAW